jgi:hypothetical protein
MSKKINKKHDKNGRFIKASTVEVKPEPTPSSIELVRQRLIEGYYDIEEVRACYQQITSNENPANHLVMRRTILNYEPK